LYCELEHFVILDNSQNASLQSIAKRVLEMLSAVASCTEAYDLWSIGVTFYMLLSGAPPFYGKNGKATKASIIGNTNNNDNNNNNNNNNITEILKYVTWDRKVYPIQQGIPKSHLPEKLPRSNLDALYCKLVFHRVHKCMQAYVVSKGPP
jgi:serine/threonine protein kinase